ncbi:hypothetical protein P152DRAFT_172989 [Eremomyces bilateralis CBS 781.70]|uniref:Acyltransferase 3 domain-containing protein n=1 Tax=Eremomyces bilateralis CBS 781.70 TaxID=1392243 RepID=A0A6G1FTA8_9PEZI|nr:uncharacterized protein P152DRAFT_172989 [Eremomyces bilateralis CBS 781.70]KAF1809003.1 hypothetical protein P152DRAFT_172989 [Eremomyces bilateralis CBS 781.70]
MASNSRESNWVDGLRGIAAFIVVSGHVLTAFAPEIHAPSNAADEPPTLMQLPFFRLLIAGRAAVALFFLITGYVNTLGPLVKAKAAGVDVAFSGLSKNALKRPAQLILPAFFATLISWGLANVGAYKMGKHIDATWIRQGYHAPGTSISSAIYSLFHAEASTWTEGWNEYDGIQWAMIVLLEGSMIVYLTLLATLPVTPKARRVGFLAVYFYGWIAGTAQKTMNVAFGMLLADLHVEVGADAALLPAPFPIISLVLGLFLCSFPQDAPDRTAWTRIMVNMMSPITPAEADIRKYWDSIGACLIVLGVYSSPNARRILSHRFFNFLGRVSLPVYLIHNQLMKTVLTWLIYLPSALNPPVNEQTGEQMDLQRGSSLHMAASVVVFFVITYRLALVWTKTVDPLCARIVDRMTKWAYDEEYRPAGGKPVVLPP